MGAAFASGYRELLLALGLVGAAGGAVNSASGRAVMHWFGAGERGFALGVRQTAIPLGGLIAALSLPPIADAAGTKAAFLFLAALSAFGALVGAVVLRGREASDGIEASSVRTTLADGRLWRLSVGSGLYLYAQIAVLGFGVLFLVDEHGLSGQEAALVFAGSQVLGGAFRIGGGRWSDLMGARVVPLRRVGLAIVGVMTLTAALAGGPIWLARARSRPRGWADDGVERALVHGGRGACRCSAERSHDRRPADGAARRSAWRRRSCSR